MPDQPTNGPYHWGNGPKPQRRRLGSDRPSGTMMAAAWLLILVPGVLGLTVGAFIIHGHLAG